MFFQFDIQRMEVKVVCGPNEEYKPDEASKKIHEKCQALKGKMEEFMRDTVDPEIKEIREMCNKKNEPYVKKPESEAPAEAPAE